MNLTLLKYTEKTTKQDLFRDSAKVQKILGKNEYSKRVEAVLDGIETSMRKGLVVYDPVSKQILCDRASILDCLFRHHSLAVPSKG